MSENDKNVFLIVCDFHTKLGKMNAFSFSKEEISKFHIWNFESGRSTGRTVHFLTLLRQPKFPGVFSVHIDVVLLINFPEQFYTYFVHAF